MEEYVCRFDSPSLRMAVYWREEMGKRGDGKKKTWL